MTWRLSSTRSATRCTPRSSFDLVGEDVLVSGAGPIGVMAAAVAKHVGARNVVITDVNEYRLELARKMGVTRAVNVAKENLNDVMAELGMTEGFDVGLEMSGAPPAFPQHAGYHEPRRPYRDAGYPAVGYVPSTGPRSSSKGCLSKVSMVAKCSKPGTRWRR